MGSCYSTDHIADDHIHTDITSDIEEPQQKYRLGNRLVIEIDYWGLKLVLLYSNHALCFRYSSTQPDNYHQFNRPTQNN